VWGLHQLRCALERTQILTVNEVHAVTAYILNLGGFAKVDFVLSDKINIRGSSDVWQQKW
jgi:hypothetical protein